MLQQHSFLLLIKMKSGNKSASEKKELRRPQQKDKTSDKTKIFKKKVKVDTDFHHEHPFREQ
jgi:hypothetical protein